MHSDHILNMFLLKYGTRSCYVFYDANLLSVQYVNKYSYLKLLRLFYDTIYSS
jgi:hypothetical protein